MPITINGSAGTITGVSTGGLPDGCVDTDTLAANAVTAAKSTGLGISVVDQWRVTTGGTLTTDGTTGFTSNWERGDTNSHGQIGSGMTESSGIFTFPSTGIYQIIAIMSFKRNSGDNRYANLQIEVTTNNSSYNIAADGFATFAADYNISNAIAHFLFDVTDTSTHKVKFEAYTNRSSVLFLGNTGYNEGNSFTFIRLGDT
tara:strand:- start:97 stop:699 length:603 start_codon:yes stop_codon:yes gene_type:complete